MEHRYRAYISLSFAGMAFVTLFHGLVIRQVYPGFNGGFRVLAPLMAGFWALSLLESWAGRDRSAPFLALGCFAAMGYGLWLGANGASLVGTFLLACAATGLVCLSRLYFLHLGRPDFSGEQGRHLLNHAGGQQTSQLRKTR